ncbi:MAG: type II toxin-antitoxin system RelE/ParE family toxin [Lachnospiraceae bacterium]|nr:type II toxin-antitoxin system RelE/ParE family toxin [Lachnospiraceae bacterium]
MKYSIEYSQIVRRKLYLLKEDLTDRFDLETAMKGIRQITTSVKQLSDYPKKGMSVADVFGVDTDFRYLYVGHNYVFYYIEDKRVIIAELFDEREDFMYKLFGISSRSVES